MRPFSCGTQFMDWEAANCERCTKNTPETDRVPTCPIQYALVLACITDGEIGDEIAARMTTPDDRYNWPCGEVEWTEARKAEWTARQQEAANAQS